VTPCAIIFDFDGLILDTETPEFVAWQEAYAAHGATLDLDEWSRVIGTMEPGWDPGVLLDGYVGSPVDRARTKPDPAVYRLALSDLGVDAAEAIAVEDSPNGIAAAKAAGLFVVAVPNRMTAGLDVSAADLVLSSLEESTVHETVTVVSEARRK
jgi:beta-phosphoglucomutase-like phosphatase (HAD superfamily)